MIGADFTRGTTYTGTTSRTATSTTATATAAATAPEDSTLLNASTTGTCVPVAPGDIVK